MNGTMDKVRESVMEAYCDCHLDDEEEGERRRNLRFRAAAPVSRDEAVAIMRDATPHGYNAFTADLIALLPEDAQVTIAREGSVCLYVRGKITKATSRKLLVDEHTYDVDADEKRLWWD